MIKRRRESDRGGLDWKFVAVTVLCTSLAWCLCKNGQANYNSLQFACFHRSFSTSQIVKSYTWEPVWETTDLRQHRAFTHHWKLDSHVFVNHLAVLTHRSLTVVVGASVDVVSVALWTCSSRMSGSSRRTIRTSSMQTFTLYLTALRARLRNSTILNLYNFTA